MEWQIPEPLAPFSFLTTVDPDLIVKVGYGFIPDTTHLRNAPR